MNQKSCFLIMMFLVTGCAFGNKHSYHQVHLNLHYGGDSQMAVATHDQRPYVVSGDKQSNFVGLQRGGYGNPFDVTTASGKPLAEDMTAVIVQSLSSKGFTSTPVMMPPAASYEYVRKYLEKEHPHRFLLINLIEWKSDTYQNTALIYNVDFQVFDAKGTKLASKNVAGKDDLRGSFWDPPGHAKRVIPTAFKALFEQVLNDSNISGALK